MSEDLLALWMRGQARKEIATGALIGLAVSVVLTLILFHPPRSDHDRFPRRHPRARIG